MQQRYNSQRDADGAADGRCPFGGGHETRNVQHRRQVRPVAGVSLQFRAENDGSEVHSQVRQQQGGTVFRQGGHGENIAKMHKVGR